MPKIPRDISGKQLIQSLKKFEYNVVKQTGSHIKLVRNLQEEKHSITIPNHTSIKLGTLNNILSDLSQYLKIEKQKLIEKLF